MCPILARPSFPHSAVSSITKSICLANQELTASSTGLHRRSWTPSPRAAPLLTAASREICHGSTSRAVRSLPTSLPTADFIVHTDGLQTPGPSQSVRNRVWFRAGTDADSGSRFRATKPTDILALSGVANVRDAVEAVIRRYW